MKIAQWLMRFLSPNYCPTPHQQRPDASQSVVRVALVGNPNSGKSTVFNALTGGCQRVGNWPGVTVEKKTGYFSLGAKTVEVIDLPGIYSFVLADLTTSIDERIASEFLSQRDIDCVVNIVDGANLERHLYLTLQLIEMGVPVILAVNMLDVAEKRGLKIDLLQLQKLLGCPVLGLCANRQQGMDGLKKQLAQAKKCVVKKSQIANMSFYPAVIQQAVDTISHPDALRLLEGDQLAWQKAAVTPAVQAAVATANATITAALDLEADLAIADARYRFAHTIVARVVQQKAPDRTWTQRLDRVILNRLLGIPIFLCTMYLMFFFAINVGGAFQDFFDIGSHAVFVDGLSSILQTLHTPAPLIALLANGIGQGVNTTVTFIPVMAAMFFFLAVLEDSGYMARAAFVVDRVMRALGLPGKAFVPMVIGFGCNVPAIMAARTLDNPRDRLLTVMMSPFVSCGARLAIYAVFVAAFFPSHGQNIVFLLYVIGILLAVATGFLLRKTGLSGEPGRLLMELPPYHVPTMSALWRHTWQRLRGFVLRAGRLIIPICLLLGALNTLNIDGSLNQGDGSVQSVLSAGGRLLTPVFAPMGITSDNWPATVGLLTGVLAKEVVIGTLNTLYSQASHLAVASAQVTSVWSELQEAVLSIPTNLAALGSALTNPVLAQAPVHSLSQDVYGVMYQKFAGQAGAFAYLLFVLLYFPCVSTVAVMRREVGRRWAWFSVMWSTGVAYVAAVAFYQAATFLRHPWVSSYWLAGVVGVMLMAWVGLRWYWRRGGQAYGFV